MDGSERPSAASALRVRRHADDCILDPFEQRPVHKPGLLAWHRDRRGLGHQSLGRQTYARVRSRRCNCPIRSHRRGVCFQLAPPGAHASGLLGAPRGDRVSSDLLSWLGEGTLHRLVAWVNWVRIYSEKEWQLAGTESSGEGPSKDQARRTGGAARPVKQHHFDPSGGFTCQKDPYPSACTLSSSRS